LTLYVSLLRNYYDGDNVVKITKDGINYSNNTQNKGCMKNMKLRIGYQ